MSTAESSRPASFCRLCLTETKNKVDIFGKDETNILNLLTLIELDIDPDSEPEAGVCFDCIVTLEGFFQFKEQCHVNDDYIKNLPSEKIDSDDDETVMPNVTQYYSSEEEEGLIQDCDETPAPPKRKLPSVKSKPDAKQGKVKTAKHAGRAPRQYDPHELEKIAQELSVAELDKVLVLQDSYPDFFHFERGRRSIYFTLVYYGERYNSATYNEKYTIWQCANRRRFQCPARVHVTNDYTDFERSFEHTHGDIVETEEYDLFTPKQALPELFKMCKQYIIRRKAKGRRRKLAMKKQLEAERTKHRQEAAVSEEQIIEEQVYDNDSLLMVLGERGEDDEDSSE